MNEAETRAALIDPALKAAGWGIVEGSQIRREFSITLGRLQGFGKRSQPQSADYVLIYKNKKLAVIEAKKRDDPLTRGVAQAKEYAEKLDVRYTYSTNGIGFYQIDMKTGHECKIDQFLTPQELWDLTFTSQNEWRDRFARVPYEDKGGTWKIRYYQDIAIEKALQAIAEERNRILLTLATGTGKTSIAFQIAWKLFQSRWNLKRDGTGRPRILFLADRNNLADQAYNDFSAFSEDSLKRIDPKEIGKTGSVPKNASVFFTIFQTFMSGKDDSFYFGEYPPDFFDFIVIDECHRGGANDESTWRGILEYFSPAVQLGLTATPKRRANIDTYAFFGEPVYIYSLKEGINDGFLTPFKVKQFSTTVDEYVYTTDDLLLEGEVEQGKRYGENDFNKTIKIKAREKYRVKLMMNEINQREKTIVFCRDQQHALEIRDLINQMKSSKDPNYCVRVTSDDGGRGDQFLETFRDNEKTIPTILTTSHKLTTGVDARNVRNIVLMRPVKSMIEFKQIIGRGTRIFDGKDYFTIYDFVKAYEHFNDSEWDGEPIDNTSKGMSLQPTTAMEVRESEGKYDVTEKNPKILIKLSDGKERTIQHMMATSFWGPDGKPLSATEFLTHLFGQLPEFFKNEEELRVIWKMPDTRKALLDKLSEKGYGIEQLNEIKSLINAEKSDLYDVLAYVAFASQPITRSERVAATKDTIFSYYHDSKQQAFLDFVLTKYVDEGVCELSQEKLPILLNIKYRAMTDAVAELGSTASIKNMFIGFQQHLYKQVRVA